MFPAASGVFPALAHSSTDPHIRARPQKKGDANVALRRSDCLAVYCTRNVVDALVLPPVLLASARTP